MVNPVFKRGIQTGRRPARMGGRRSQLHLHTSQKQRAPFGKSHRGTDRRIRKYDIVARSGGVPFGRIHLPLSEAKANPSSSSCHSKKSFYSTTKPFHFNFPGLLKYMTKTACSPRAFNGHALLFYALWQK